MIHFSVPGITGAAIILSFVLCTSALAQPQEPDDNYTPRFNPMYAYDSGSVVMIDEVHHNFHTADYGYAPFADILEHDGYRIEKGQSKFTEKRLEGVKILVIANALHQENEGRWSLPTPSAFTFKEIDEVANWVKDGGSLFLIADAMPFPGAGADLAKAFGIGFINGVAVNPETFNAGHPDIFSRQDSSFQPKGLPGLDNVDSIATFTGQGFTIPPDAASIINLDDRFRIVLPQNAKVFDENTEWVPGQGKSQLACLRYGKGRVVVAGEAGMFTAQIRGHHKFGMNTPAGSQNYLLLLSLIHWLDGKG